VEWKGVVRAGGDEVAPIDLRIDHVYLVSCKYMSNILFNASPAHVFDSLLAGGSARRGRGVGGDWYAEVAPAHYQRLYDSVRRAVRDEADHQGAGTLSGPSRTMAGGPLALPGLEPAPHADRGDGGTVVRHSVEVLRELPVRAADLTSTHRSALRERLKSGWPGEAREAYRDLSDEVARASVARWQPRSRRVGAGEAMLWRLLRIGSAPYFVLGSSATQSLRLRIATPWDWKQLFGLVRFEVFRPRRGPTEGRLARRGARTSDRPPPRGLGPRRGAVESWEVRRPPRSQGIPRYASPHCAGLLSPAVTEFDLSAFEAPLTVPELPSGPVVLRPFNLSDLPFIRQAAMDPYIVTVTSVPSVYSDDEGRAFIDRQREGAADADTATHSSSPMRRTRPRVWADWGCGLHEIENGRASIGYWVAPSARGRHLAGWGLRGAVAFAFEALAIPRLHLFIEPWNVASQRTAIFAGFSREALLRGWERIDHRQHDAYSYALLRREWQPPA
jgi:ribosomal-protein-alanine N-acetyltransferase